jgi:hypothetical protein
MLAGFIASSAAGGYLGLSRPAADARCRCFRCAVRRVGAFEPVQA